MDPFIGEIRIFAGTFAPVDWAFCQGQLLSIAEFSPLFSLIGTTYGGDGVNTFALPNLLSRVPTHQGTGTGPTYVIGQAAGVENVTLLTSQIPSHSHVAMATSTGTAMNAPAGMLLGTSTANPSIGSLQYGPIASGATTLASTAISNNAGGIPHTNIQPYLAVNFIIALFGIFPTRS